MKSNTVVTVAVCVMVLVLVLWRGTRSGNNWVIRVEMVSSQSSALSLERILKTQNKTIVAYKHVTKIVYRCLDDEPKIKYPKRASDDYTTVTMGTNDECGNTTELDAVLIVHTAVANFEKRERFRKVYADRNVTWPYKLKVVFLIGRVLNAELQINLEIENRKYGDTVQGNFLDTYQNLTLKATMGYRWVSETCKDGYKLLVKIDDDVIMNVRKLFRNRSSLEEKDTARKRIFCQVWKNAPVNRSGKWKVEKGLLANANYTFPYCSGFLAVVTPDIVKAMFETARSLDFFWIDDVFMYGMVPQALKNITFTNLGTEKKRIVTHSFDIYKKCYRKMGNDCSIQAVVTSNSDEFFEAFQNFKSEYD